MFLDPQDQNIQSCFFANKKHDLLIEFVTRKEGVHKIYLYIKDELVDETPFFVYVNGDLFTTSAFLAAASARSSMSNTLALGPFASWPHMRHSTAGTTTVGMSPRSSRAAMILPPSMSSQPTQSMTSTFSTSTLTANNTNTRADIASTSVDDVAVTSARSLASNSTDSLQQQQQSRQLNQPSSSSVCLAGLGNGTIMCARKDAQFHFVITEKNIQGLCVYGKLD